MKSFREKLIEVANVSYLSYCKLNSVDPDVKKGWSILGGPWTQSRWWSMDWGSVKCIHPNLLPILFQYPSTFLFEIKTDLFYYPFFTFSITSKR